MRAAGERSLTLRSAAERTPARWSSILEPISGSSALQLFDRLDEEDVGARQDVDVGSPSAEDPSHDPASAILSTELGV